VRDCYEAYVLYQFFQLLVVYIETSSGRVSVEDVLLMKDEQTHPCPLCCLPTFKTGPTFYLVTKQCILQYVIIKPACALITGLLQIPQIDLYREGKCLFILNVFSF
jgi:hypothetical protein